MGGGPALPGPTSPGAAQRRGAAAAAALRLLGTRCSILALRLPLAFVSGPRAQGGGVMSLPRVRSAAHLPPASAAATGGAGQHSPRARRGGAAVLEAPACGAELLSLGRPTDTATGTARTRHGLPLQGTRAHPPPAPP